MKGFLLIASAVLALPVLPGCDNKREAEFEKTLDEEFTEIWKSVWDSKKWEQGVFHDDFGDRTGQKYIDTRAIGSFSNSATWHSLLYARLLVYTDSEDHIGVFLCEYDAFNPAAYFIGGGSLKMKNSAGEVFQTRNIGKWNQKGGLSIRNATGVIRFLKKSIGEVKIIIEDDYSSSYHFTINANGFNVAYNALRYQ